MSSESSEQGYGEYTCARCERVNRRGRPDNEALAEALGQFGQRFPETPMILVCGPCYQTLDAIHGWSRQA